MHSLSLNFYQQSTPCFIGVLATELPVGQTTYGAIRKWHFLFDSVTYRLDHKEIYFHLFVIETGLTANCQKTFV